MYHVNKDCGHKGVHGWHLIPCKDLQTLTKTPTAERMQIGYDLCKSCYAKTFVTFSSEEDANRALEKVNSCKGEELCER